MGATVSMFWPVLVTIVAGVTVTAAITLLWRQARAQRRSVTRAAERILREHARR